MMFISGIFGVGCPLQEYEALLEFKASCNGTSPSSWGKHRDCCLWKGVICSNSTEQVSELHLSELFWQEDQSWQLNLSIFSSFRELRHLDLSWNSFTSPISSTLRLKKLKMLDLEGNELTGEIPTSLEYLTSLEVLNLGYNYLNGSLSFLKGHFLKLKALTEMVITWIIFLLTAMVHVKDSAKPKRSKRTKRAKADSDTESETESIDWDNIEVEGAVPTVAKGKAPAEAPKSKPPPTAAEKGKAPMEPTGKRVKTSARKRSGAQGISVNGTCSPETTSAGNSVYSRELKKEYKYLNFIVCYNVLPNMNTKIVRWERLLFLFLLGNPTAAMGANLNIPYLIWNRMTRYVAHSHPSERLPYPMIIMRILRRFKVDTSASSYMYSLGTINETTIVKSLTTKQDDPPSPPIGQRARPHAPSSTAPVPPKHKAAPSTSDDDASVTSIFKEQQRLSNEQERMSAEFSEMKGDLHIMKNEMEILTASQVTLTKSVSSVKRLVKKLFAKMGCTTSDDSDSQE